MNETSDRTNRDHLSSELRSFLLLFIFTFVYMVYNKVMDSVFPESLGDRTILILHYLRDAALIAGYIISAFTLDRISPAAARRICIAAPFALAVCAIVPCVSSSAAVHTVFSFTGQFMNGAFGTAVYSHISSELKKGESIRPGIVVGVGGAAAVALHWLLMLFLPSGVIMAVICSLFFAAACIIALYNMKDTEPAVIVTAAPGPDSTKNNAALRAVIALSAATLVLILLFPFYEVYLNSLEFMTILYGWPRLVVVAGYLLIGIAETRLGSRFSSVLILCLSLISVVFMLFMHNAENSALPTVLFYLLLGSIVTWYITEFIKLAPRTSRPALTAPAGRIIDASVTMIFGLLALNITVSTMTAAIINLGLIAAAIISVVSFMSAAPEASMIPQAEPDSGEPEETKEPSVTVLSDEERLRAFSDHYGLSDRESEVLELMVTSEETAGSLAEKMFISRSLFQRYVARIYEKTSVSSRIGLLKLYLKEDGRKGA